MPAPPDDVAVSVDGVSKTFRLPQEQVHTLKERVVHPLRRRSFERLEALKDVSLSVGKGEFFGIVGRNGSGKSTLMKCLAGIYTADGGEMWLRGRMAPFIELGVGFNPDLTAHDNVLLNAVMLGLSPDEADARYDAIIDFAELREFQDLKLKNYSSGMQVRLAFAVDGPRRRRPPAHRRGAGGGRRRVPAEVLRRPAPGEARRAHDPARHARHGPGPALL